MAHFPKFLSNQTKVASKEDVLKLFFNSATLKLLKEFINIHSGSPSVRTAHVQQHSQCPNMFGLMLRSASTDSVHCSGRGSGT